MLNVTVKHIQIILILILGSVIFSGCGPVSKSSDVNSNDTSSDFLPATLSETNYSTNITGIAQSGTYQINGDYGSTPTNCKANSVIGSSWTGLNQFLLTPSDSSSCQPRITSFKGSDGNTYSGTLVLNKILNAAFVAFTSGGTTIYVNGYLDWSTGTSIKLTLIYSDSSSGASQATGQSVTGTTAAAFYPLTINTTLITASTIQFFSGYRHNLTDLISLTSLYLVAGETGSSFTISSVTFSSTGLTYTGSVTVDSSTYSLTSGFGPYTTFWNNSKYLKFYVTALNVFPNVTSNPSIKFMIDQWN